MNMKKLVDEMLYLARTDATQQMVYSLVNLSDLVWSSVLPFESVAFEQGLELESDIAEGISLQADEGRLREPSAPPSSTFPLTSSAPLSSPSSAW